MKVRREDMHQHVSNWRESDMSQAEFARRNQLNLHGFRYWISKFQREENDAPAFIALNGIEPVHFSLHYPNGVELLLPVQTPVAILKSLIHFGSQCSR